MKSFGVFLHVVFYVFRTAALLLLLLLLLLPLYTCNSSVTECAVLVWCFILLPAASFLTQFWVFCGTTSVNTNPQRFSANRVLHESNTKKQVHGYSVRLILALVIFASPSSLLSHDSEGKSCKVHIQGTHKRYNKKETHTRCMHNILVYMYHEVDRYGTRTQYTRKSTHARSVV